MSTVANLELYLHVQLKDAKIQESMMASRKFDLKSHERKLKQGQVPKPKLKPPVGEELIVPAKDVVVEYHHPFEAGKHHHLGFL